MNNISKKISCSNYDDCFFLRSTYIRGQNLPVDAEELAERERRRQVALSHQEAIRQQLEDRERRRREERERRIKEEREEELRIERDQEIERQRREEELKQLKEKQERERKRKEAIQEAIELAQKEAELIRQMKKVNNTNWTKNNSDTESSHATRCINDDSVTNSTLKIEEAPKEQLNNLRKTPVRLEPLTNDITNNLEEMGKVSTARARTPAQSQNNNQHDQPQFKDTNSQNIYYNNIMPNSISTTPRTENIGAVLLQPAPERVQNIQYALLVPVVPQTIPVVPSSIPQSARTCSTSRTENRILTPSVYRNKNSMLCDSSTQTEESVFTRTDILLERKEKYVREKLSNLELSYENRNAKERRSRSESLEERPKWGANRPPTRYLKQSEKDLLYQKRKLRQKVRGIKGYDYKNSSDDSQPESPMTYRRKTYSEKRSSRALWRKHDQIYNRNIRMYQSEVIPLTSDKGQIFYRNDSTCCCSCRCNKHRCSEDNIAVDMMRIDHISPRNKASSSDKLPEMRGISDNNIYNNLSELHDGLSAREEHWEHTPSTPSLSSAK